MQLVPFTMCNSQSSTFITDNPGSNLVEKNTYNKVNLQFRHVHMEMRSPKAVNQIDMLQVSLDDSTM